MVAGRRGRQFGPGSFWGRQTGPNPTDRAKLGSKRHLVCDGRGVPLAIQLTGANRNDSQQPLWGDRIVLLLNPQAAVWDLNGTPRIQLLGASQFDEVSVKDLDRCSQNANQNAWALANGKYLTPAECKDLLSLDPFYGKGQWLNPTVSHRGIAVGSGSYGRDPLNPASPATVKFSDIFTYQSQQSSSVTATYNTTITDVIGFSWSEGLSLAYQQGQYGLNAGFNAGTTLTQGEKITNGESMKVVYSASTVVTTSNATQIDGVFGDDHDFYTPDCQQDSGKCYHPSVSVFIDELFGSYMFQDPATGCNPRSSACRHLFTAQLAGGN